MFEITADDCGKLDDRRLRELVGLLCEAELRRRGLPVSGVTWGGDQNAGDGGIDVRVTLPPGTILDGFVPRPQVGFQVKKPDMPPAAIRNEMRPNGQLRAVISELATERGAYIIVSAGSSSDIALRRRIAAMAGAAEDAPNRDALFLDYYDRTRLASWVRTHAGVTVWVRQQIGRALAGWEPFGPWAHPLGGAEAAFLLDDAVRLNHRAARDGSELGADAGLAAIRAKLANPQSVVRLVGLSGVGKTRLAQALFDDRVGTGSLDPSLAIYCDMNNAPEPQPVGLASNLIADDSRAIVIVDNCGADLHKSLADLIRQPASRLSVMTIEYDIQDDQPEATEVFELQAASVDLIEKLVRARFPAVSAVDARTAAVESGGNARIAIALAGTVAERGTLAGLSDEALFRRLFVQRQQEDKPLLETAQVLALVYSYQGEELGDGETGELYRLGAIIGTTPDQLFRATSELLDRDLAQRRGVWRAILPHAIANRLAAEALRRIPFARIHHAIVAQGSERLIKSFSRRLGYLHASPHARSIVEQWFAPGGWLADVWNLNHFGRDIFTNLLPVAPHAGLEAIERGIPTVPAGGRFERGFGFIRRALWSLAYDADLFGRSLAVQEFLYLHADERGTKDSGAAHSSLFRLHLSGTMAPPDQRIEHARRLLLSGNERLCTLGLDALSALLEGAHFLGHGDYQFGARSRDYGWRPRDAKDVSNWFGRAFALMAELRNSPVAEAMRGRLSTKLRGIWSQPLARAPLQDFCVDEARHRFWGEGWRAVKTTRYFDARDRSSAEFRQLTALEEALRPTNLIEQIYARVLARRGMPFEFDLDEEDDPDTDGFDLQRTHEGAAASVTKLGEEAARDIASLHAILPDLFVCEGDLWNFGRGLARGAEDARALWDMLVDQLARQDSEVNVNILRGILNAFVERDSSLTMALLDAAVTTEPLARHFPLLQLSIDLDAAAVERLLLAIEFGKASMWTYENLAFGGATDLLTGVQLAAILNALAEKQGGVEAALRILEMRLFSDGRKKVPASHAIIEAGRALLLAIRFQKNKRYQDHSLGDIVVVSLTGVDAAPAAFALCTNLREAVAARETYGHHHHEFLRKIVGVQPEAVLDAFLGGDAEDIAAGIVVIEDASAHHPNPLDALDEETLIAWCLRDPEERFLAAAASVSLFPHGSGGNFELSAIGKKLLQAAPNRSEIVRRFARRCRPTSWSGSRAAILESRTAALAGVDVSDDEALRIVLEAELALLADEARSSRDWELAHDSERDERFE